jgi:hypothetical protein
MFSPNEQYQVAILINSSSGSALVNIIYTINILPIPKSTISVQSYSNSPRIVTLMTQSSLNPNINYQWSNNASFPSCATPGLLAFDPSIYSIDLDSFSRAYPITQSLDVTVTVIDSQTGCSSSASYLLPTNMPNYALERRAAESDFRITPTITFGNIHIQNPRQEIRRISILDLQGRVLMDDKYFAHGIDIHLDHLPQGIYIVRAYTESYEAGVFTTKVVKQ